MHANQIALAAPVTARDLALGNLPLPAQRRLKEGDGFQPLARAMVLQYVDTVEALQQALAGDRPSRLPRHLFWKQKEGEFVFTSSAAVQWKAQLRTDGGVTITNGDQVVSFEMTSSENESWRRRLVRTVAVTEGAQKIIKCDEVDLEEGSRHSKGHRVEPASQTQSSNFAYDSSWTSHRNSGNSAY